MTPFNTWIRGPPCIYPSFSGFCRRAKRLSETTEALTFEEYQVGLLRCCIWQTNFSIYFNANQSAWTNMIAYQCIHISLIYPHRGCKWVGWVQNSRWWRWIQRPRAQGMSIEHPVSAASKKEPSCQMLTHAPKWAKKAASDFRCPKDHRNSTCSDPKLVKFFVSRYPPTTCASGSLSEGILIWFALLTSLPINSANVCALFGMVSEFTWPLQFGEAWPPTFGDEKVSLSQPTNPPPGPDRQYIHPQLQEPGSYQSCWKLHYLDFSEMVPVERDRRDHSKS